MQTMKKREQNGIFSTKKNDVREWIIATGFIAVGFVLYRMVQSTGMIDTISPNESRVTLGVALLIGVVASLSSCMATIGGVVIAFAQNYAGEEATTLTKTIRPHIAFHAGRIGSFFILGGVLGLVGGTVHISGTTVGIFNIGIAIIMAWLGLTILGIAPSIARIGIRMPEQMTRVWNRVSTSRHAAAPFVLGGLSFFLPCGFTQSMQLFALASGSTWIGGISMAMFAIGTMPALMTLGVLSSWSSVHNGRIFKKVAGLIVLLFALATFNAGHAVWGSAAVVVSPDRAEEGVAKEKEFSVGGEQVVRMRINVGGFDPAIIEIKKGIPVKWIISTDQPSGCTNRIIIPSLDISKDIAAGDTVIYFTPQKTGKIPFSCWMGMVRGSFIVK